MKNSISQYAPLPLRRVRAPRHALTSQLHIDDLKAFAQRSQERLHVCPVGREDDVFALKGADND
jgi:hypothetical protein